ncbi:MAG: hypothetical protein PVI54_16685, partial [Desulfobacteraceae bacterium]
MFEARKKNYQLVGIGIVAIVVLLGLASTCWSSPTDYDGTYYGTFSGDDSGYWVVKVSYTGDTVFLFYSTSQSKGDVGIMTFKEESDTVGNYYTDGSYIQSNSVNVYIDSTDRSVTGEWGNEGSSESGTLSGSAYTSCSYD